MIGNAAIMIPQKKSHLVLKSDATFLFGDGNNSFGVWREMKMYPLTAVSVLTHFLCIHFKILIVGLFCFF